MKAASKAKMRCIDMSERMIKITQGPGTVKERMEDSVSTRVILFQFVFLGAKRNIYQDFVVLVENLSFFKGWGVVELPQIFTSSIYLI